MRAPDPDLRQALFEKELAAQGALATDAAAAALATSVVRASLLPHQLQALAWMLVQEDEAKQSASV